MTSDVRHHTPLAFTVAMSFLMGIVTTIAVYSLRARERPTVSTPVTWAEVERAVKKEDAASFVFEAGDVLKRIEKHGDLFEPVLELKQKLPEL